MSDKYLSRFINGSDLQTDTLVFKLRSSWWSRTYEYAWAASFVQPGTIVLDAACGISHPLKFYLADHCTKVYACDIDERILDEDSILQEIVDDLGPQAADAIRPEYFNQIHFDQTDLAQLPYSNGTFDTIFCISVLEHLDPPTLKSALREFKRTLKEDGLIVLTFDYPQIDLTLLQTIIQQQGLSFYGSVDFALPADAISADDLYCFRAVLTRS